MMKQTKTPYEFVEFEELKYMSFVYPSEAQKKSGQYVKYRVELKGQMIDIETLRNQVRSGKDEYGFTWKTKMLDHYGYFIHTLGADDDEVDVFINGKATEDEINERPVFAIKQVFTKGTNQGEYDEDKLIIGAKSMTQAKAIYLRNYSLGWQGLTDIREVHRLSNYLSSTKCRTL